MSIAKRLDSIEDLDLLDNVLGRVGGRVLCALADGAVVCVLPMPTTLDDCPTPAKSSTWERLEEQYIAPDYYDNPFNWEYITYDEQGLPHKTRNPDYPQLPAIVVDEQPGYSTQ